MLATAARTRSSHGARSASSSGRPACIAAIASALWRSSASTNGASSRAATSRPMVLLPAPATPMSTMRVAVTGSGSHVQLFEVGTPTAVLGDVGRALDRVRLAQEAGHLGPVGEEHLADAEGR